MSKYSEFSIEYLFEVYDIVYDSRLFNPDDLYDMVNMIISMGRV